MPALVAFMKIPHRPTALTDHLADMRRFMPAEHRAVIEEIQGMPSVRERADKGCHNEILEGMAAFRQVHYGLAEEYINRWVTDPRRDRRHAVHALAEAIDRQDPSSPNRVRRASLPRCGLLAATPARRKRGRNRV